MCQQRSSASNNSIISAVALGVSRPKSLPLRPAARRCSTSSRWQADDGPAGVLPGHGPGVVEKAESGYGKVQADLTVMRRAPELPYDWLADNTRWQRKPRTFDSVEDALRNTAAFYRKALWNEADSYVEIWLEKDALAGVVYPVTSMYDVPLMVARGYASLSFLYSAAEAINELDVPAYIYLPMIGFLNGGSSWEYAQMAATFRKGFGETGLLIVVLALVKPLSPPGDLSGQLICGPIEA
jgi:hypothetical protein